MICSSHKVSLIFAICDLVNMKRLLGSNVAVKVERARSVIGAKCKSPRGKREEDLRDARSLPNWQTLVTPPKKAAYFILTAPHWILTKVRHVWGWASFSGGIKSSPGRDLLWTNGYWMFRLSDNDPSVAFGFLSMFILIFQRSLS